MSSEPKKVRIAHIVSTFPPYKGGIGNICFHFVKALSERGLNVEVITPKNNLVDITSYPFPVHRWRSWLTIGNASILPQLLWRIRCYDIVHIHYPFIGCELVFLAKLFKPKMRIIVSYHMDLVGNGLMRIIFNIYQFLFLPIITRLAETIIFSSLDYGNSSKVAKWILKHPKKIKECAYGVDTNLFQPQSEKHDEANMLQVIFVAALDRAHYFKGLSNLLIAISKVTEARLQIVGDGNMRSTYEKEVGRLGIHERVVFHGRLSDEELAQKCRAADVLVLPSIDRSEAFGLVLLEAMSSGIPVIASRLPGVSKLIRDKVDGLLITPGDIDGLVAAVRYFADRPIERRVMGLAARQKVLNIYQWPHIASQIEIIYGINAIADILK